MSIPEAEGWNSDISKDIRIIDFSIPKQLPENFTSIANKRMIYACGDGGGGFDKVNANSLKKTNIEEFSKIGFNIFCCIGVEPNNIEYLRKNPYLNIVLCILTGDHTKDYPILERLFQNSLDCISTDDTRIYPSAKTSFTMLKLDGIAYRVHISYQVTGYIDQNGKIYESDFQWGSPNFTEQENIGNLLSFKKISAIFDPNAKYIDKRSPNTSRNEKIAKRLGELYNNQKNRKKTWNDWRNKHPLGGGKLRYNKIKTHRKGNKKFKKSRRKY